MTGFDSKRQMAADKQEPAQEPVAWAVQGCAKMWSGEFAEIDAKAEAKRIGGTCVAYALYTTPPAAQPAQEPAFKWRSVFQEMPAENSHILFCFGVHIVEGSFTKNGWASLAYGTAQPDFWAYFPPPPHHKRNQELYAMPPKRPWVGLTDEERNDCLVQADPCECLADPEAHQLMVEVEAKLRDRNS